jgi:hypothetical protein
MAFKASFPAARTNAAGNTYPKLLGGPAENIWITGEAEVLAACCEAVNRPRGPLHQSA